jgi:signal transduction histidine kinase
MTRFAPRLGRHGGFFCSRLLRDVMKLVSPYLRYQELQRYVGWTEEDAARVHSLLPLVAVHFEALIEDFYAEIERHPDARQVITGGEAQINRLKLTLRNWLAELFSGQYDQEYVERRWKVGYRHVEIGLDQVYTNAALSRLRRGILDLIDPSQGETTLETLAKRASLNTLIDLDLAIIEDAYQTEYRRRQGTAERLATIGKVAGGIAHELRNPLNVVKTSVYYLVNARNASPEKIQSHLDRIERQVGVADRVITALNDFARLPFPQIEAIDLQTCLRDVLELNPVQPDVEVECVVDPPSLMVMGDVAQLHIVFGNLVRNGREAMPEGGRLRISAVRDGAQAVISVQDTGIGISSDDLPRILEPLYSTKAKGIGLGLSITHDIVRRHQGSLTVASQPGAGSTFTIRLKACPDR